MEHKSNLKYLERHIRILRGILKRALSNLSFGDSSLSVGDIEFVEAQLKNLEEAIQRAEKRGENGF